MSSRNSLATALIRSLAMPYSDLKSALSIGFRGYPILDGEAGNWN
jgi:hypothetical protein